MKHLKEYNKVNEDIEIDHRIYHLVKFAKDHVFYCNEDGILANHEIFIDWGNSGKYS